MLMCIMNLQNRDVLGKGLLRITDPSYDIMGLVSQGKHSGILAARPVLHGTRCS